MSIDKEKKSMSQSKVKLPSHDFRGENAALEIHPGTLFFSFDDSYSSEIFRSKFNATDSHFWKTKKCQKIIMVWDKSMRFYREMEYD